MALTPEDVVNKRFQPTKFREGYDQDEVDDFLDEVLVELRRLNQENDELKQRVAQGGSAPALVAAAPAVDDEELRRLKQENEELKQRLTDAEAQAQTEAAHDVPAVQPPADESEESNNLLQLARRLHDEYVNEGLEKSESLISEARVTAARFIAEAEAKQRAIFQDAASAERRVDELRSFEREYRQGLKSYLEGQLNELDSRAVTPGTPTSDGRPSIPAPVSATSPTVPSFPGLGG